MNYPYQAYPQVYNTMKQEVVRVNGENGARTFQMPPNSSVILMDESAPLIWLCVTDGAGYKTITPYDISPHEVEKPIDMKSLVERIQKLEDRINEQSNVRTVEQQPVEKQYLTVTTNNQQIA